MTNSTSVEANVEKPAVDQIADLLVSDEEKEKEDELTAASAEDEAEAEDAGDDTDYEEDSDESEEEAEEAEEDEEESSEAEDDKEITWASALGVEDEKVVLDDDGNLKAIKVKVDGQEDDVDVKTLISGWQSAKSNTQKSQTLSAERKQFEKTISQSLETYRDKLSQAEDLVNLLGKRVASDNESTDWARLRLENPGEYAAKITEYQKRQHDLQGVMRDLQNTRQTTLNAENANKQKQRQEFVNEQAQKIVNRFPEWKDKDVAKQNFDGLREFTKKYGYSDEEFATIADSRAIEILYDAKTAIEKLNGSKKIAEKKVKKPVPKFRSASANRKPKKAKKASKLDRLVKQAKSSTGSSKRTAQTDAIAELLMQS